MYERFTDRARKAIQLANQEAQRAQQEYIGTEHLLMGLVKEGSGVAAVVLKNFGLDLRQARLEAGKVIQAGMGVTTTMGRLPQTPRIKKTFEVAIDEAQALGNNFVGTEHLLLGLLADDESVAVQILRNLSLQLQEIREDVLQTIQGGLAESGVRTTDGSLLWEYELFIPVCRPDGSSIDLTRIEEIRQRLGARFRSCSVSRQEIIGNFGGVGFNGEVIVLRVLASVSDDAQAYVTQLKDEIMRELPLPDVLVLKRKARAL